MNPAEAINEHERLVEMLVQEIASVRRRLELSVLQGDYEAMLEAARDIIFLELKARRVGAYVESVERELLSIKEFFATAVAVSSAGAIGARSVKKKARVRLLVAGRGVVDFEFGSSWRPSSSKRK